jgi:hypothetical protein
MGPTVQEVTMSSLGQMAVELMLGIEKRKIKQPKYMDAELL